MKNARKTPADHLKPHRFKKGNKAGRGRDPLPEEVKVMRQLSRDDLVSLAMMVFNGDAVSLQDLLKNLQHEDPARRPTPIQALMASCLLNAIKKGDATVLNGLLDRFFGRMPIAIQVNHAEQPAGSTAKTIVFETVEVVDAATG